MQGKGVGSGDQRGCLTLSRLHSSVQINISVIAKLLLFVAHRIAPVEPGYNLLQGGGREVGGGDLQQLIDGR